ncbi:MAG TPA: hypothetical protein DSN98_06875 [Thermoplasmata archaeon]|jgi:hypothetical protein|nr:MAG TPA: hypothetical protein DSN98_06875 [Thermoplasmata archaeon]
MKKIILGLTLAALLFIAAVNPAISAKKNTQQVTIELSTNEGTEQKILSLSTSDADTVRCILDGIDEELDKVSTDDEKYEVFISTVTELYPYGVFGNLTLPQAKQLVTCWYHAGILHPTSSILENRNAFCLVAGHTDLTLTSHRIYSWMQVAGAAMLMLGILIGVPFPYVPTPGPLRILIGLLLIGGGISSYILGNTLSYRTDVMPIAIGDIFGIGYSFGGHSPDYAQGYIHTVGLLGNKNWTGQILGDLPGIFPYGLVVNFYQGIWGFTGIKIWMNEDGSEKSYLGSALLVGIQEANASSL